jgi:hypothetical protein
MAAAAAELQTVSTEIFEAPLYAEAVPLLPEDIFTRRRAARFIGACVVSGETVFAPESSQPIESLHDAIHMAAEGDPIARKMVETNVRTDVIERTIKTGHVIKVEMMVNEAGQILQYGQSMESVQANSLRFAAGSWQMRERTEAEATNSFRIEDLHRAGLLEDNYFVVLSRAADNMTESEMKKAGFFTETMSCAMQLTTAEGEGLSTESAFVSGVRVSDAGRHDESTVIELGRRLGVDLSGKTAAEVINTPLLVPKSLLPNGAIDLVRLYDDAVGGTFFGEDRPREDYLQYRELCDERERMFQPKIEAITRELIAEAAQITSRPQAARRLHKLSEKHMVEQAAFDDSIDARVFGETAASHIRAARKLYERGDYDQALRAVGRAKSTAESSSCPTGALLSESGDSESENGDTKGSSLDCEFISKKCPMCGEKNVKTKVTKSRISGSCGCSKSK